MTATRRIRRSLGSTSLAVILLLLALTTSSCQAAFQSTCGGGDRTTTTTTTTTTTLWGKRRQTKKSRKTERSRPNQFYEAIKETQGGGGDDEATASTTKTTKPQPPMDDKAKVTSPEDAERQTRAQAARDRMEARRPDVTTMIVDEDSGMEVIAQGKAVMDVVTRKPVVLSTLGAEYRLAQLFPGVPPDVRDQYRLDWTASGVPEIVEQLTRVSTVTLEDGGGGTKGIPPHPSISNAAIDWLLANRDLVCTGDKLTRTLGRLQLRSMSQGNVEQAQQYTALLKHWMTVENHVSAPFRQMLLDGEGRVGPNFGNLDLQQYCGKELYERCADYLVLKGMVAHWEKKVVDAHAVENTPQTKDNYMTVLSTGDPRRYLPDPPILFTLKECTQVCYMAQQMTKTFFENDELVKDFPPELRFMETALTLKGGAELRKYMIEEFCPAQGLTPDALIEGMRRLLAQLQTMQTDPYGDLVNTLERLTIAMAVGSEYYSGGRRQDPFMAYIANKDPNGPGAFQTYTFNHAKESLVRFLDAQYERSSASAAAKSATGAGASFFNFGGAPKPAVAAAKMTDKEQVYQVPAARAMGRPHELGWLELLSQDDDELKLGKVPPGRIIME